MADWVLGRLLTSNLNSQSVLYNITRNLIFTICSSTDYVLLEITNMAVKIIKG